MYCFWHRESVNQPRWRPCLHVWSFLQTNFCIANQFEKPWLIMLLAPLAALSSLNCALLGFTWTSLSSVIRAPHCPGNMVSYVLLFILTFSRDWFVFWSFIASIAVSCMLIIACFMIFSLWIPMVSDSLNKGRIGSGPPNEYKLLFSEISWSSGLLIFWGGYIFVLWFRVSPWDEADDFGDKRRWKHLVPTIHRLRRRRGLQLQIQFHKLQRQGGLDHRKACYPSLYFRCWWKLAEDTIKFSASRRYGKAQFPLKRMVFSFLGLKDEGIGLKYPKRLSLVFCQLIGWSLLLRSFIWVSFLAYVGLYQSNRGTECRNGNWRRSDLCHIEQGIQLEGCCSGDSLGYSKQVHCINWPRYQFILNYGDLLTSQLKHQLNLFWDMVTLAVHVIHYCIRSQMISFFLCYYGILP